jgi:hypothetical protein
MRQVMVTQKVTNKKFMFVRRDTFWRGVALNMCPDCNVMQYSGVGRLVMTGLLVSLLQPSRSVHGGAWNTSQCNSTFDFARASEREQERLKTSKSVEHEQEVCMLFMPDRRETR